MTDLNLAQKYLHKAKNARDRGIGFDLSFQSYKNLMRAKKCHYTGVELTDELEKPNSRTIDRIDNTKPYTKGNVVACAKDFNQMKGRMEQLEAMGMVQFQSAIAKMFNRINEVQGKSVKMVVKKGKK